ncbi:MAG: large repetitive protein [Gaiellaceae bacterium]|nr:large repetitive protein [Gaiellaceae bacterium]
MKPRISEWALEICSVRSYPRLVRFDTHIALVFCATAAAALLSAGSAAAAAPTITGFSPPSGATGEVVTISGTGFVPGATAVKVHGRAATVTGTTTSTQILAIVPDGATTGPIAVSTTGGTATSAASYVVTFTLATNPPWFGPHGTLVTIRGAGFTNPTTVRIGGLTFPHQFVTYVSPTELRALVPIGLAPSATPYVFDVYRTTAPHVARSPVGFWITPFVAPTISSLTPSSGPVGASVTINGTALSGASAVTFNGKPASYTIPSPAKITATVPAGATTGPVAMTTPPGSASSPAPFTVTFTLSGFSPTSGAPGTAVTINGAGFNASSVVKFGGATATTRTLLSATQLRANVPAGATTGKITVTNTTAPIGTVTSTSNFAVTAPVSADWPQAGHDAARTGFNAGEHTIGVGNVATLHQAWAVKGWIGQSCVGAPVVSNGVLYGAGDDQFGGGVDFQLDAFDATTGAFKWDAFLGQTTTSPSVDSGRVFAGGNSLRAFAATSGTSLWPSTASADWFAAGAVSAGGLVFTSDLTGVFGLHATDGTVAWSRDPNTGDVSPPASAGGLVFAEVGPAVGSHNDLYAFNAASGTTAWSQSMNDSFPSPIRVPPTVAGGRVFATDSDGDLQGLLLTNPASSWFIPSHDTGADWTYSGISYANGTAYATWIENTATGATGVTGLDAINPVTGSILWTVGTGAETDALPGMSITSPVIANGVVYVGAQDGHVYAFNASTGAPLRTFTFSTGCAPPTPIVANGTLYVGSDKLYAFRP